MVDMRKIATAILDVERRKQGQGTIADSIQAKAEQAIALREQTAKAGLAESDEGIAAGKLGNQGAEFEQGAAESGAKVGQSKAAALASAAAARSSDATASYRGEQEKHVGDFSLTAGAERHTTDAEGNPVVTRSPRTASQLGLGAENFRLVEMADPDNPGQTIKKWVTPKLGETYQQSGDTDARLAKVGQIVEVLGGLALKLNADIGSDISGRMKGAWMKMSAMLNMNPDAQVYGDSLSGAASQLAKAFGESGRLSDQDIQRTVNMFPRPGDSIEVTRRKLAIIDILVGVGIADQTGVTRLAPGSMESMLAQRENTAKLDQFEQELADLSTGLGQEQRVGGQLAAGDGVRRAKSVANAQGGGVDSRMIRGKPHHKVPGGWEPD